MIAQGENKEVFLGCFPNILHDVAEACYKSTNLKMIALKSGSSFTNLEKMRNEELDMMLYIGKNSILEDEFAVQEVGHVLLVCVYPKSMQIVDIQELAQQCDYVKLDASGSDLMIRRYLTKSGLAPQSRIELDLANHILGLINMIDMWSIIVVPSGDHLMARLLNQRVNHFVIDDFEPDPLYLVTQKTMDSKLRQEVTKELKLVFDPLK